MNNPIVYYDPTGESFLGDVWRVATGDTVGDYSWTQLNNFAQWADETDWFPSSGGFSMSFDMPYNYAVNSHEPLSNDDSGFNDEYGIDFELELRDNDYPELKIFDDFDYSRYKLPDGIEFEDKYRYYPNSHWTTKIQTIT